MSPLLCLCQRVEVSRRPNQNVPSCNCTSEEAASSSLSLILEVTHARALGRVGRVLSFSWVPCSVSPALEDGGGSLIPGSFWSASLDETVHSNLEVQRALIQKREVELGGGDKTTVR